MKEPSNKQRVVVIHLHWTASRTISSTEHLAIPLKYLEEIKGKKALGLLQDLLKQGVDDDIDTSDLKALTATVRIMNEKTTESLAFEDWWPTHRCYKTRAGNWKVVDLTWPVELCLSDGEKDFT